MLKRSWKKERVYKCEDQVKEHGLERTAIQPWQTGAAGYVELFHKDPWPCFKHPQKEISEALCRRLPRILTQLGAKGSCRINPQANVPLGPGTHCLCEGWWMPAAWRLYRFGLFKLRFWLLQHKPTTAHGSARAVQGCSPTSAQLVSRLPAAAAAAPLSALLSADGSAAPLPRSRMKCSLAASSQPNPLLPWPTAVRCPHLSFSPSALTSPAALVSVTLLCLSQDERTHPICSESLNSPGKADLHLECPSLLPSALEEKWQQIWAKESQKASEYHPF